MKEKRLQKFSAKVYPAAEVSSGDEKKYRPPVVEILTVEVEQGFALSGPGGSPVPGFGGDTW